MKTLKQICPHCRQIMNAKVQGEIFEHDGKTTYILFCTVCHKTYRLAVEYPLFEPPTKK